MNDPVNTNSNKVENNSENNNDTNENLEHDVSVAEVVLLKILEKNKTHAMQGIPPEKIYMFQIYSGKKLKRKYESPNYKHKVNIKELSKLWKTAGKLFKPAQELNEFYYRFDTCWVGSVQIYGMTMYMVVADTVDVEHFKTQLMTIFESFTY